MDRRRKKRKREEGGAEFYTFAKASLNAMGGEGRSAGWCEQAGGTVMAGQGIRQGRRG